MNDNMIKTLTAGLMHGLKVSKAEGETIFTLGYHEVMNERNPVRSISIAIDNNYKPYLFPMSSLTKEIEFKGKRFVPIVELYKLTGLDLNLRRKELEFYPTKFDVTGFGSVLYVNGVKSFETNCFSKQGGNYPVSFLAGKGRNIVNHYTLYEKLIEWHFNLHNLSPDQFIEVNETNNPYKI